MQSVNEGYRIAELPEFDAAEYLNSEEAIAAYLADVSKVNDAALLATAFDDVTRARCRIRDFAHGRQADA
jgi:probable addiction module antidote protein